MDSLNIAASGMRNAELRVAASAHNVANVNTRPFYPVRVAQTSLEGGGAEAHVYRDPRQGVDLAREFIEQDLASVEMRAWLRFISSVSEMRGRLVDIRA